MSIKQKGKSLHARHDELSDAHFQLTVLNNVDLADDSIPRFSDTIANHGHRTLTPSNIETLQINIGKLCNQTCAHCHVDAGPDRTEEQMSRENLQICLDIIEKHNISKVDITGGAPELNVNFRWFVEECAKRDCGVINRCNLTIIVANKKFHDLPEFFAKHKVEVVSSLPYFSQRRTDSQRGDGVFEDSIKALKMLNKVGYGVDGSGLILDLVYNPTGTFLPSGQAQLEAEFKRQLDRKFGITFNKLFTITNLPISRFLEYLMDSGLYAEYMNRLVEAFNPDTVDGLMCRSMISVSWDGYIYDCDFNQMLDMKVASNSTHISNFNIDDLRNREILVNQHCYGCTAGAGSSCGGTIVE